MLRSKRTEEVASTGWTIGHEMETVLEVKKRAEPRMHLLAPKSIEDDAKSQAASFHVCSSHLLCIASVPGAREDDYKVDEELNR